jgi:hypothetical protein
MSNLWILILILLGIFGVFAFFIIKDLIFLIEFLQEKRTISIYNKNYKRYHEEKKRILDKRLQHEKELREEYGLDNLNQQEEIIVGFVEPKGKHSQQEFGRNFEKYSRIAKAAKEGKSLYWRTMLKIARSIEKDPSKGRGR